MSNFELDELLPNAITKVKKAEQLTYVEDGTIEQALREWFRRILFSATSGFVNEKSIDEDILKVVKDLWDNRTRFDRGQFINKFDKWLGDCSRNRIKKNISNDVISEFRAKKIDNKKRKQTLEKSLTKYCLSMTGRLSKK